MIRDRAPDATASELLPRRRSQRHLLRLAAVVAALLAVVAVAKLTGLHTWLDREQLRAAVDAAGPLGVLLFVVVFAVGELLYVPGMVFVGLAVATWGLVGGSAAGLLGAIVSVCTSFYLVRAVGGRALAKIDRPLMRRLMAPLDKRPIITVTLLRLVFFMAPALNYALALTGVRFRDYLAGSALGLLAPVVIAALLFEAAL